MESSIRGNCNKGIAMYLSAVKWCSSEHGGVLHYCALSLACVAACNQPDKYVGQSILLV